MEYDKSRIEAVVKDVITKRQGPFRHSKDQVEVIQMGEGSATQGTAFRQCRLARAGALQRTLTCPPSGSGD
jgi:hypothetical protein